MEAQIKFALHVMFHAQLAMIKVKMEISLDVLLAQMNTHLNTEKNVSLIAFQALMLAHHILAAIALAHANNVSVMQLGALIVLHLLTFHSCSIIRV